MAKKTKERKKEVEETTEEIEIQKEEARGEEDAGGVFASVHNHGTRRRPRRVQGPRD